MTREIIAHFLSEKLDFPPIVVDNCATFPVFNLEVTDANGRSDRGGAWNSRM